MSRRDVLIGKLSDTMDPDNARALLDEVVREQHLDTKQERDFLRWTLDNIYTLARRELRRLERLAYTDEERDGWRHVIRLSEKAGCQGRGVLRDNGGSINGTT